MKLPKLKYYYYALNETDYEEFARTRTVQPNSKTTLNPVTGIITNTTPFLYFYSSAPVADTRYRQLNHYQHYPVYVLRIPREYVRRDLLTAAPDPEGMWIYNHPILLPHCAVERFELDPNAVDPAPVTLARSHRTMVTIPIT